MSTSTAKYDVKVQLTGRDGNAYAIMSAVSKALRQAGASDEEVYQYQDESMSGDYDNLLRVAMKWVNVQ
jgi:ribosomal protein S9